MKSYCLASSSAGNCYILEFEIDGVPTRIMVECGIPITEIYRKSIQYKIDLSTIKCCLITHAHGDHCRAANSLNITKYAHKDTLTLGNFEGEELVELKPTKVCEGISVMAFPVEHDIAGAMGFVIKTKTETVMFINDHKRWTVNLSKFKPNYVFIECNYDHKVVYAQVGEIKKKLKNETLSYEERRELLIAMSQHERNLNSHCSLIGTIKGLNKLNLKECCGIFLMHLSDRYANEYRMKQTVMMETGIQTFVALKNGGIK